MGRGVIDIEGMNSPEMQSLKNTETPDDIPFCITKIGHVVLKVKDLERSVDFYTQILGFCVSDVYPENMMPGRMVFMRCNRDHHGVALVGGASGNSSNTELHHMAFEVSTIVPVEKEDMYRQELLVRWRSKAVSFLASQFALLPKEIVWLKPAYRR